jgi:hypothetical protein
MTLSLKTLLSLVTLLFLLAMPLLAQDQAAEILAQQGAAAYEQRDFRQAISLWTQLVNQGEGQPSLYFNLARAYEYLGEWGDARINDLRVKAFYDTYSVFGSESPDVQAALERGWARQDLQTLHPLIWLRQTLRDMTRPIGWGVFGALLWIGFWITVLVSLRRRVGRWILAGLAAGIFLWIGVIAVNVVFDRVLIDVVSVEPTPIYSGPGTDYALLATWAEGYDLSIVATKGEWAQVWRADGMSGWVDRRLLWEVQHIDPKMY